MMEPRSPRWLEEYLDHGPQGDNYTLTKIAAQLEEDRLYDNLKALELLGTAVGTQRKVPQNFPILAYFCIDAFQGPFRDSGLLQAVLQNLGSRESSAALIKQYLRIVGNCVADNGERVDQVPSAS
jgi:hypothetical protein